MSCGDYEENVTAMGRIGRMWEKEGLTQSREDAKG
jgi:hypothetical protein